MHNDIWKKYQFVTEVQTALLANVVKAKQSGDANTSLMGTPEAALTEMNAVFQAAELIPDETNAHEAAVEYVTHLLSNSEEEPDFSQVHLTS